MELAPSSQEGTVTQVKILTPGARLWGRAAGPCSWPQRCQQLPGSQPSDFRNASATLTSEALTSLAWGRAQTDIFKDCCVQSVGELCS